MHFLRPWLGWARGNRHRAETSAEVWGSDKDGDPTLSHNSCVTLGKALLPSLQLPYR